MWSLGLVEPTGGRAATPVQMHARSDSESTAPDNIPYTLSEYGIKENDSGR
jgi:hypothetical protein